MTKLKKFLTYTVMSGTLIHISVCTIHDNPDRVKESAKSGTKSVCVARLPQSYLNQQYQKRWMYLTFFILSEINKYTVKKCIYTLYRVDIYSTSPYVQ